MNGRQTLIAALEARLGAVARAVPGVAEAAPQGRGELVLFAIGIDHLGTIVEAFGAQTATHVRLLVQERLTTIAADPADQFLLNDATLFLLRSGVESREHAQAMARQMRQLCSDDLVLGGARITLSVSIGVAFLWDGQSGERLLQASLRALCSACLAGAGGCHVLEPASAATPRANAQILQDLERALESGDLQAWFMPIVDLNSGSLVSYEALLRWRMEDGAIQEPDSFLPLVSGRRLANRIDLAMVDQAIDALAQLPAAISVSVNLHASTLVEPELVARIEHRLRDRQLQPDRLLLEITETSLLRLDPIVRATIESASTIGLRWLLDDFGVGFSSISHLRDLPIHGIKLDRSFAAAIDRGEQKSLHLAQGLAGLAEGLALQTIAEGIESGAVAHSLQQLGWVCGQGWNYGRAAPLQHWLRQPLPIQPAAEQNRLLSMGRWALAVSESVPVGLFTLRRTLDGRVIIAFASRRCIELLRLDQDTLQAKAPDLLARLDRDDHDALMRQWQSLDATNPHLIWEGRLNLPDTMLWLRIELVASALPDGTMTLQGAMSDVTQRKTQELHLRRILDEAPIPIAIQELKGEDPRVIYMNRQFTSVYGYDTQTTPTLSAWAQQAYPDPTYRREAFAIWDEAIAKARQGAVGSMEFRVLTRSGQQKHMLASAVVIGDEMVISAVDLSDYRSMQRQLAEARAIEAETALSITEAIPVGTYTMVQPQEGGIGSFVFMSDRFLAICGLDREVARSDPFQAFACVHPDDYDEWVRLNAEVFANKTPFYGECRVVVDGRIRWISAESVPRALPDGSTVWEGVLIDITDRKRIEDEFRTTNQRLQQLASTDSLTGCGNRRHLEELIEGSIRLQDRHQQPLSLILCDIDCFKMINDGHGHQMGDHVLKACARLINETVSHGVDLGRWGGEEFILLAAGMGLSQAVDLAEQLRQRVAEEDFPHGVRVTASFGVAEWRAQESSEDWFRRLDRCLYRAKRTGRNTVVAGSQPL